MMDFLIHQKLTDQDDVILASYRTETTGECRGSYYIIRTVRLLN